MVSEICNRSGWVHFPGRQDAGSLPPGFFFGFFRFGGFRTEASFATVAGKGDNPTGNPPGIFKNPYQT